MLEIERGYESVNKTFRIPVNIIEQLERLAGENNTSVNKVVVQCLQYALDNISTDSSDDKKWFLTALQSAVLFFARYHRFVYIFKWYDIFHITIQMLTYANEDSYR